MKLTSVLFNVVLALAVLGLCFKLYGGDASQNAEAVESAASEASVAATVYDNILSRASVRDYTDREIESATLDSLLLRQWLLLLRATCAPGILSWSTNVRYSIPSGT